MYCHSSEHLPDLRRPTQTPLAASQPRRLFFVTLLALTVLISGFVSLGCRAPQDDLLGLPMDRTATPASDTAAGTAALTSSTTASRAIANGPTTGPTRAGLGAGQARANPANTRSQDVALQRLLLSANALPTELARVPTRLPLANDEVAQYFPDPAAAAQAMATSGRVSGIGAVYQRAPGLRGSERVQAISSSVALYQTPSAAQAVLQDATLAGILTTGGLTAVELSAPVIGEGSRLFRATSQPGDSGPGAVPERVTYLVQYQTGSLVGSVLVELPEAADDQGRLVQQLATRQAGTPVPATLLRG
jgi:hypothetical protein